MREKSIIISLSEYNDYSKRVEILEKAEKEFSKKVDDNTVFLHQKNSPFSGKMVYYTKPAGALNALIEKLTWKQFKKIKKYLKKNPTPEGISLI